MSPQQYTTFATIFAVVGIGHLLMAATAWTRATRRAGLKAAAQPVGRSSPFARGRDRVLFNWGLAAGVFFSGAAVYLTSLSGS
ncbi:hypothetical protein [Streptomyces sp. NPDC097610]|uniref:hypothetical protein n=1 Tax=Streptomyces sp. NPDC097610 TaxID=3157227 RepID=UPI00332B3FFB